MALVACASNPDQGYHLQVLVRSSIALDRLQVYYDTGGLLPTTSPPTAGELAANQASAEWSKVLAIDIVDATPPAQTFTYENSGGPRFVAIIGSQDVGGSDTMVNGGTIPNVEYLDGPDSAPTPQSIANETLDLEPL